MKVKTVFRCLKEYLNEHDISYENITVIATDVAPATLLKQNVQNVLTIHCIHQNYFVAKKLSGQLHQTLMICVKAIR